MFNIHTLNLDSIFISLSVLYFNANFIFKSFLFALFILLSKYLTQLFDISLAVNLYIKIYFQYHRMISKDFIFFSVFLFLSWILQIFIKIFLFYPIRLLLKNLQYFSFLYFIMYFEDFFEIYYVDAIIFVC